MAIDAPIIRLAAASFIAVSVADAAPAQDKTDNWLTRFLQAPTTASVPASAGAAREWSGQSGASGNP